MECYLEDGTTSSKCFLVVVLVLGQAITISVTGIIQTERVPRSSLWCGGGWWDKDRPTVGGVKGG